MVKGSDDEFRINLLMINDGMIQNIKAACMTNQYLLNYPDFIPYERYIMAVVGRN